MKIDAASGATILGMALVTYGLRVGGLWLMGRVTLTPRVEAWLRRVPGAVLVAIVAPAALAAGPAGVVALLATVLVMARTRNLLLALAAGVGTVWLLRNVL